MSTLVMENIPALESMKQYPKALFFKGDLTLLQRPKVSIVGTRRPSNYTRQFTYGLAKALASRGGMCGEWGCHGGRCHCT